MSKRGEPITVLMPAYNAAQTVEVAITSTLRSLRPTDFLHVRDDGSSDGTMEEISKIQDPRLICSRNEKNLGLSATLNIMLDECQTTLVGRMDADDQCLPWRFDRQRRALENGDKDFIFSTIVLRGETFKFGALFLMPPIHISTKKIRNLLPISCLVSHGTMLAKTEALRQLGGWQSVGQEDYILWLTALARGFSMSRLGLPAVIVNLGAQSLSRQPMHTSIETMAYVDSMRIKALSSADSGPDRPNDLESLNRTLEYRAKKLAWRNPLLRMELGLFSPWRRLGSLPPK